jgi:hypothetical protein
VGEEMSDDLIKRDDALAAITLGETVITLQNRIRTIPAVDTAAIREAALREAADVAVIHYYAAGAAMRPEFMPTRFRDAILALIKGETK